MMTTTAATGSVVDGLLSQVLAGDLDACAVLDDVVREQAPAKGKAPRAVLVEEPAYVRYGTKHPAKRVQGAYAVVTPGKSIRIVGLRNPGRGEYQKAYDRTFEIGDVVEYDSYNLKYHGTIVAISDKAITVKPEHSHRTRRMTLNSFTFRNYDLDLAAAFRANSDALYYL